jgi:hypothetical protein
MRVTTSEFVLSVQKSIDSCKFKVVSEGGQQKSFSKRLLGPGNTAYLKLQYSQGFYAKYLI